MMNINKLMNYISDYYSLTEEETKSLFYSNPEYFVPMIIGLNLKDFLTLGIICLLVKEFSKLLTNCEAEDE